MRLHSLFVFIYVCSTAPRAHPNPPPLSPAAPAQQAGPVAFCAMLAYITCFALGCGPIPWVYLPEILPPAIKGPAQSFATGVNWAGNLAVGLTVPATLRLLGLGGSYAVYAAFCLAAATFCARFMVETSRRPLARVHEELLNC